MPDIVRESDWLALGTRTVQSVLGSANQLAQTIYSIKLQEQVRRNKVLIDSGFESALRTLDRDPYEVQDSQSGGLKTVGLADLNPVGFNAAIGKKLSSVWDRVQGNGETLLPEAQAQLKDYFDSLVEPAKTGAFKVYTDAFNTKAVAQLLSDLEDRSKNASLSVDALKDSAKKDVDAMVAVRALDPQKAQELLSKYNAQVEQQDATRTAFKAFDFAYNLNAANAQEAKTKLKAAGYTDEQIASLPFPGAINPVEYALKQVEIASREYWAATPERRQATIQAAYQQYTQQRQIQGEIDRQADDRFGRGLIGSYFKPDDPLSLQKGYMEALNTPFKDAGTAERYISLFWDRLNSLQRARAGGPDLDKEWGPQAAVDYNTLRNAVVYDAPLAQDVYQDGKVVFARGNKVSVERASQWVRDNAGAKNGVARIPISFMATEDTFTGERAKRFSGIWGAAETFMNAAGRAEEEARKAGKPYTGLRYIDWWNEKLSMERDYDAGTLSEAQALKRIEMMMNGQKVPVVEAGLKPGEQGVGSGVLIADSWEKAIGQVHRGELRGVNTTVGQPGKQNAAAFDTLRISAIDTLKKWLGKNAPVKATAGDVELGEYGTGQILMINNGKDEKGNLDFYGFLLKDPKNEKAGTVLMKWDPFEEKWNLLSERTAEQQTDLDVRKAAQLNNELDGVRLGLKNLGADTEENLRQKIANATRAYSDKKKGEDAFWNSPEGRDIKKLQAQEKDVLSRMGK